jgi:hypothetical protein
MKGFLGDPNTLRIDHIMIVLVQHYTQNSVLAHLPCPFLPTASQGISIATPQLSACTSLGCGRARPRAMCHSAAQRCAAGLALRWGHALLQGGAAEVANICGSRWAMHGVSGCIVEDIYRVILCVERGL